MSNIAVNLQGQDNLSKTVKQAKQAVDELKYSTTELGKCSKEFDSIANSGKSLKTQLRQLQQLMSTMNMKGLSNSDEFTKIAQYAGQIKDAMSDASDAVRRFSSDTQALDATIQGVQGVAAAASVATGAMALFGTKNDEVTRAILKVQSALAVLNGIQQVANVLNKDSALMQRIKAIRLAATTRAEVSNTVATTANTVAERANTAATAANTVAQNSWNVAKAVAKALLGDFTGLLLVGIAGLTTYAIATSNAADEQEKMNDEVEDGKKRQEEYQQTLRDTANSVITPLYTSFLKLQAAWKATTTEAEKKKFIQDYAQEIKNLGVEVNSLTDAENLFVRNTDAFIESIILRAKKAVMMKQMQDMLENSSLADAAVPTGGADSLANGKYSIGDAVARNMAKELVGIERQIDNIFGKFGKPVKTSISHTTTSKTTTTDEVKFADGSLDALEAQLQAAKKRLTSGLFQTGETEESLKQLVTDLETKVKEKKISLNFEVSDAQKQLEDLDKKYADLKEYTPTTSSFDQATGNSKSRIDAIEEEMTYNDGLIRQLQELKEAYEQLGDVQGVQKLSTQIADVTEKQVQLGVEANKYTAKIKEREKEAEAWGYYAEMIGGVSNALNVLGDSAEAQTAQFAVNSAALVANAVKTIAAMNAEAMAKGASSAFALPFPANLAAWATILTTITSIFSSLPKFAEGGIIGGGSYYGDKILARVNAGEMVLNTRQQQNLFNLLDGGGAVGGMKYEIDWRIKGSDLYGSLKNYKSVKSKVGKGIL